MDGEVRVVIAVYNSLYYLYIELGLSFFDEGERAEVYRRGVPASNERFGCFFRSVAADGSVGLRLRIGDWPII